MAREIQVDIQSIERKLSSIRLNILPEDSEETRDKKLSKHYSDLAEVFLEAVLQPYVMQYNKADVLEELGDLFENYFSYRINYSLARIIDYVYDRNEVKHSFGGWLAFDYYLPLFVWDFVQSNFSDANVNLYKLSNLILVLIALSAKRRSKKHVNKMRMYLEKRLRENPTEEVENTLEFLKQRKKDLLVFHKPLSLYKLAGIEGHTFNDNYIDVLNEYIEKYSFRDSRFVDRIYQKLFIAGAKGLAKEIIQEGYSKFRPSLFGDLPYSEINKLPIEDVLSNEVKDLWDEYERYFLKSQENRGYLSMPMLSAEMPFIRIKRYKGKRAKRLLCHIPSEFVDIKMLLYALYGKEEEYADIVNVRQLRRSRSWNNEIKDKLKATVVGIDKRVRFKSDFWKKFNENGSHYYQVKRSFKIISEISSNGIAVDKDKLEEEISKVKDNPKLKKELWKIKKALFNVRNNGVDIPRLYSVFVADGGSTHRVISSSYNLQSISKEARKLGIFTAPSGYELISYDVSGQDLVVALTLAKKIIEECKNNEGSEECSSFFEEGGADGVGAFLNKLSSDEIQSPIDYFLKTILNSDSINLSELLLAPLGFSQELIEVYGSAISRIKQSSLRDIVKGITYMIMYGGGAKSIKKNLKSDLVDEINNFSTLLTEVLFSPSTDKTDKNKRELFLFKQDEIYSRAQKLLYKLYSEGFQGLKGNINAIVDFINEIKSSPDKFFMYPDNPKYIDNVIMFFRANVALNLAYRKRHKDFYCEDKLFEGSNLDCQKMKDYFWGMELYKHFEEMLKDKIPGLYNTLKYMGKFYKNRGKTYPTFLGWSAQVDIRIEAPKNHTSPKNYPIQASGGELMREWLLNLHQRKSRNKLDFKIVNVVHDQIVVEANENSRDVIDKHIRASMEEAAANLGIQEGVIKLKRKEGFSSVTNFV